MDESLNEGLEELFKDLDPSEQYLSDRSNDVHEVPAVTDEDKSEYKREREDIGAEVAGLKSALEQALRSMARVRKNPYLRQGKIDKKRLVAIAKGLSKDVFYRKQDGVELDVAVAITIDESGSMAGIVSETRKVAIAVCEALKAIGVPFEVTGFSTTQSWGGELNGLDRTNPILYKHYKTFEEQWDVVRSRIVNTSALKHNVDGEVVEYAAFRVAQRKERRKVILSLSDGLPMAGHGNEATMAKNLKRVCNGARKAGIEVYGFGIGTLAPKGLYGDKWFVGLDRSASMGVEFVKEFAKIVTEGKVRV
jgi:cobalamin biosynthesis protein CobT